MDLWTHCCNTVHQVADHQTTNPRANTKRLLFARSRVAFLRKLSLTLPVLLTDGSGVQSPAHATGCSVHPAQRCLGLSHVARGIHSLPAPLATRKVAQMGLPCLYGTVLMTVLGTHDSNLKLRSVLATAAWETVLVAEQLRLLMLAATTAHAHKLIGYC